MSNQDHTGAISTAKLYLTIPIWVLFVFLVEGNGWLIENDMQIFYLCKSERGRGSCILTAIHHLMTNALKRSEHTAIIVDDDKICLDTMKDMAKVIGLKVIGAYPNAEDALLRMRALQPDIAILDESLPGMSGTKAGHHIKKSWPTVKTLVVTCHVDPFRLCKIWYSGVDGLAEKDTHHMLREAIEVVLSNERYLDAKCAKRMMGAINEHDAPVPRMFEIIELLTQGAKYGEIAAELNLSVHTIRKYIKRIMANTHTHDKAELTKLAISRGWVG